MNYSIKINQVAIAHLFPTMDIKDAAILDWMSQFATSPNISILVLDGIVYRWYSYKKIIDDMPLLKIKSKRPIYDRIKKMVDLGILLAHPNNQAIGKTYYGFSELYQEIVTFKPMSKNSKGVGVKTPRGYEGKLQQY